MTPTTVLGDNVREQAPRVRVRPGTWLAAIAVLSFSWWVVFRGLAREPHFADESAMIAQSYYYTLLKSGRWHHRDWLDYPAFDHPPLPKYMFGLSLDLRGLPVPQTLDWWKKWQGFQRAGGGWVRSLTGLDFRPPADPCVLYWARVPSAVFGVGGILAVFMLGVQVRARWAGVVAALLLLANPLYLTHARRSMSDSFAECCVIASVAVALWGWKEIWHSRFRLRRWIVFVTIESLLCGLAVLAKLNGGLAVLVVLAVLLLGWLLATARWVLGSQHRPCGWNLLAAPVAAGCIGAGSFLVFLALNPFMFANPELGPSAPPEQRKLVAMGPIERAIYLVKFRQDWSQEALQNRAFEKDWLETPGERFRMTIWEGFGRYSTLGPRDIRTQEPRPEKERFSEYDRSRCLVWFPLCLWGLCWAVGIGWQKWRAGEVPQGWGLAIYCVGAVSTVMLLIPLNWDRYYLPLQPCCAVLVPYGIAGTLEWVASRLVLTPPEA